MPFGQKKKNTQINLTFPQMHRCAPDQDSTAHPYNTVPLTSHSRAFSAGNVSSKHHVLPFWCLFSVGGRVRHLCHKPWSMANSKDIACQWIMKWGVIINWITGSMPSSFEFLHLVHAYCSNLYQMVCQTDLSYITNLIMRIVFYSLWCYPAIDFLLVHIWIF